MLTPDQIQAEMMNQSVSVKQSKDGIFLTVVMKADSGWEKIAQLQKAN